MHGEKNGACNMQHCNNMAQVGVLVEYKDVKYHFNVYKTPDSFKSEIVEKLRLIYAIQCPDCEGLRIFSDKEMTKEISEDSIEACGEQVYAKFNYSAEKLRGKRKCDKMEVDRLVELDPTNAL